MDRDQKLEIAAFVIFAAVVFVIWLIAKGDNTLGSGDMTEQRQRLSEEEAKRMELLRQQLLENRKAVSGGVEPNALASAEEINNSSEYVPEIRPALVFKDPNIQLLDGGKSINQDADVDRDRKVLSVRLDVNNLTDELKEQYKNSEDNRKTEIFANTQDMEWAVEDETGKLYLRSKGGMVEIHNITPEIEDSIAEELILTKRYISGKGPVNEPALQGYKPVYERDGAK